MIRRLSGDALWIALLTLAFVLVATGLSVWHDGVSFDLSVTVGGVTVNAYHYQRNARYSWGIQQWGMDP